MRGIKRFFLYILIAAVLTLLVGTVFRGFVTDCVSSGFTGENSGSGYELAVGSDGFIYIAGDNGSLTVAGSDGVRERVSRLPKLTGIADYRVEQLSSYSGGLLLSVVSLDGDGNESGLHVYAVNGDSAIPLISLDCKDGAAVCSSFTDLADSASFAVWQNGECDIYNFAYNDSALTRLDLLILEQCFRSAVVNSDGSALMYFGGDALIGSDGTEYELPSGCLPVDMWCGTDCVYLLDGSDNRVKSFSPATSKLTELFELTSDEAVAVNVAEDGSAAVLGGGLYYRTDGELTDISTALNRSGWLSVVILAAMAIGILFASYAVWYLLCEVRKLKISMLLRKGALVAVLLAIGLTAALQLAVSPFLEKQAEERAMSAMRIATVSLEGKRIDDAVLAGTAAVLSESDPDFGEARLYLLEIRGAETVIAAASDDTVEGIRIRSLLWGGDFAETAAAAWADDSAYAVFDGKGATRYLYMVQVGGGRLVAVCMDGSQLKAESAQTMSDVSRIVWACGLIIFAIALTMLQQTRRGVRRVITGMDTVNSGNLNVEVVERGGDELESLADSFNTMTRWLRGQEGGSSERGASYMRFVPQQIITLLGVDKIEDVDKHTFSSRYMATMSVRFSFDEKVYESRDRRLFDNINEVIERTAGIIPRCGGTIYDFSHNGYDGLLEAGTDACVSAAVAIRQEVIALNRDRERNGASPVKLHIALDLGEVMIGVVGDETRMEATAISSSFNTTRMLTTLFSRFDANILCTEEVIGAATGYGSRYIGKTRDGDEMLRVYEIFDGDEYETRTGKAATTRDFSDGVYTLYTGDFSGAKRMFMDIARKNGSDGVAKFYLYLADRFEKDPPREISLDF